MPTPTRQLRCSTRIMSARQRRNDPGCKEKQ